MRRVSGLAIAAAIAVAIQWSCAVLAQSPNAPPSKEWPTYGHDAGAMRFSPLTQITPANVGQLRVAWTYHMRPAGETRFATSEVTPLVVDGTMYIATPYSRVVALDPITGKELWAFTLPSGNHRRAASSTGRAIAARPADRLRLERRQAVLARRQDRRAERRFGDKGDRHLNTPEILQGLPGRDGLSSPPIVYKNLVITGGRPRRIRRRAGGRRARVGHAHRQAGVDVPFDPRAGEKYNDTWAAEAGRSGPA
jgi:quinoprotein glucose dehydrogenase